MCLCVSVYVCVPVCCVLCVGGWWVGGCMCVYIVGAS